MRALVIDDSKPIRSILGKFLGELGFDITEAVNGKDALEKLDCWGPPDLTLVDWNMPEMNGLEFIRSVRANSRFDHVPLMMVTTETDMEQVSSALEAGANEYVMKPFTKDVILEKLQLLGMTRY
ncbi:MAG TPA: response regulator [Pirellulales bacterium]|nr:response regulator [Pirellulales bacterium]